MSKKTILIIDDNFINRKILNKILSNEYNVIEAENGKNALNVLMRNKSEISGIILDLVMPVMDGMEFLREYQKIGLYDNIPVLVATSDNESENEKACLELGAWDLVHKPYDSDIIKLRLKNIIGRSEKDALERVKYLAEHDSLTGLYNRKKFFEETKKMLNAHKDMVFALVRFDIDRFRLINSFFGDKEGDNLLRYIGSSIKKDSENVSVCTYGRMESDVFCMCVPNEEIMLSNIVEKVKRLLREYNLSYYIEPSFGAYIIDDRNLSVETMYMRASMASKKCKDKYMTYIEYYDQSMTDKLFQQQEIMNEMQDALDKEQFVVYLQPKYNLKTDSPYGAEALVRWKHPVKGLIPPSNFIPVFEQNGFILKLDYYMWEHTCMLIRKWIDEGLNPTPISVNISRANMYNPQLVNILSSLLEKYDITADMLNLELTESAYMDNPDLMKKIVEQLQQAGFIMMMDDFGSGYSSLNTLKEITVDYLKIDMKFLPTGESNGRSERILASIIRMAGWLDLPVIVEGVETEDQKDFLESIGCGYAQGYFFARPMPWEEYENMLRNPSVIQTPISKESDDDELLKAIWSSNPQIEKVFKSILQPVAVYEYSNAGIYPIRVNQAFKDKFGYGRELNDPASLVKKYISNEYAQMLGSAFKDAIDSKGTSECEYLRISDEGKASWNRVKLQYVQSVGNVALLFGVFMDTTSEKKLEIELEKYRQYIDKAVISATKMLVVDDDDVGRAIIEEIFKDKYKVVEAVNGKQAIEILEKDYSDIAIVILDMMMPVMDGETFLKIKSSSEKYADIPVVVLSADSNNQTQINMLKMGINDYITKPFIPEIVERRISNVLEFNRKLKNMKIECESEFNRK